MKPLKSILLGIAALMASCASEDAGLLMPEPDNTPQLSISRFRSVDEARNVAQQAIAALDNKSRASRTIKDNGGVTVVRSHESRSSDSDTLMYAIDLDDNQGFVLIAGPADMSPLLAVIESGSYNDPKNTNNSGYQYYISETKSAIAKSIDGTRIPITPQPMPYWTVDSLNYRLDPSVKVNWDQGWPLNAFVSENKAAGCVPVASAMIMSVFDKPSVITYTFTNKDITSETLNWSALKGHKNPANMYEFVGQVAINHLSQCQLSMDGHKTLGRITRQIGHLCHAKHEPPKNSLDPGRTGVLSINRYNALDKYLSGIPTKEGSSTWTLYLDLHSYQAALVTAQDANNNDNGHSWVADGVWRIGMKKYYYEPVGSVTVPQPGETLGEYKLVKTEGEIYDLLHYNWGYGGNCNGWFIRTATNSPSDSYQHDKENDNHEYNPSPASFSIGVEYKCYGTR